MTDDIVTRLQDNCACSGTEQFGYTCTSCVAADEIERLRAELNDAHNDRDRWRSLANALTRDLAFRTDEQAANFIVQQMVARIERERAVRGE